MRPPATYWWVLRVSIFAVICSLGSMFVAGEHRFPIIVYVMFAVLAGGEVVEWERFWRGQ